MKTVTITLTDEQYQMLLKHTHYTNYLRQLGIGYPDPASPSLVVTDIVVNHVNQSRERSRREFAARYKWLEDREREISDMRISEYTDDEIDQMIEENKAAWRELNKEYAAFCGQQIQW